MLVPPIARKGYPRLLTRASLAWLRRCSIALLVFNSVTANTTVRAQDAVPGDDVLRVTTELLLFPIRVRDRSGRTVPGLTERDLSLKDADRATSSIYFSPGAD